MENLTQNSAPESEHMSFGARLFIPFAVAAMAGAMPVMMVTGNQALAAPGSVSKGCMILTGLLAAPVLSTMTWSVECKNNPDIGYGPLFGLAEAVGFGAWGVAGYFALNAEDTSLSAAFGVASWSGFWGLLLGAYAAVDEPIPKPRSFLTFLSGLLGAALATFAMYTVSESYYAHQAKLAPVSSQQNISASVEKGGQTVKVVPQKIEVRKENEQSTERGAELAFQKREIYLKKLQAVQAAAGQSSETQLPYCEAIQRKSADRGAHIDVYYYETQGRQWDISLMTGSERLDRAWVRSASQGNQEHIDFITPSDPQFYRSGGSHEQVPSALRDKLVKLNTAPDQICASVLIKPAV